MTDKRYKFGLFVSVFWVLAMIGLLVIKRADIASMAPNAWGDFFAGSFAPLAFLWLVLGYLQQGEELRLSTDALRLQADELKNSVEQQAALVEVSRQQLNAEREAAVQEKVAREHEARPIFTFRSLGIGTLGDGRPVSVYILENAGRSVTDLSLHLELDNQRLIQVFRDLSLLEHGAGHQFNLDFSNLDSGRHLAFLIVEFVDMLGQRRTYKYEVAPPGGLTSVNPAFRKVE